MDPIGFHSEEVLNIMNKIKGRIKKEEFVKSMHDFNIIDNNDKNSSFPCGNRWEKS